MDRTTRNIGLIVLAAGALFFPARKLYQSLAAKRSGAGEDNSDVFDSSRKRLAASHRGNHHPHHRQGRSARLEEE